MNDDGRRPPPRLDRHAGELLLRRDPSARRLAPALAEVLEAAAAPGRPEELTGRPAAVAAFRAGRQTATRPPYRFPLRSGLTRLLTLKAAVVLAAAATGGVTLAAATGTLPGTSDSPASHPPGVSAPPTSGPTGDTLPNEPRDATTTGTTSPSPSRTCPEGDVPRPAGDAAPQQQQQQGGPGGQQQMPEPRPERDTKPGSACGGGMATGGPTQAPSSPPPQQQPPTNGAGGPTPTNRGPGLPGDCRDRCRPGTGMPTTGGPTNGG